MKSLSKTLILSSTLSVLALCCSLANAAPKMDNTIKAQTTANHYMYFTPHIESEGQSRLKIVYINKQPLLPILSPEAQTNQVAHKQCKTKKKNELYELSAIFNDKLQIFLAYFDDSRIYRIAEKKAEKNDRPLKNNVRVN
ncbi:hypothetical protein AADZ91_01315 [Colwelliaceae bacterium 6441]